MPSADRANDIAQLQNDYARLAASIEANEVRFRRLARSIYRVQEDERRRLAADLHDGVGQNLTALKHQVMLAISDLDDSALKARPRLEEALALCDLALSETRELSRLLRPQVLDDLGLLPALRWLSRTLGAPAGVNVDVVSDDLPALDEDTQTLIFRLSQEALTNIVRHARADQARFTIKLLRNQLHYEAWDNGCGFDPDEASRTASSGASTGLPAMRERALTHGGFITIASSPGEGTTLRLVLPLPVTDTLSQR